MSPQPGQNNDSKHRQFCQCSEHLERQNKNHQPNADWKNNTDQTQLSETLASLGIMGALKPLGPSQHYRIEGFAGGPCLCPHCAERRQPMWVFAVWNCRKPWLSFEWTIKWMQTRQSLQTAGTCTILQCCVLLIASCSIIYYKIYTQYCPNIIGQYCVLLMASCWIIHYKQHVRRTSTCAILRHNIAFLNCVMLNIT